MASRTAYSTWTPQKPTLFDGHYLRNRSTLDIGVWGYIVIVQHKEHSPEVLSIPPGTPCIYMYVHCDHVWLSSSENEKCCKVLQKIKTRTLCSVNFSENLAACGIMWKKYGTAGQATDDNVTLRMRF